MDAGAAGVETEEENGEWKDGWWRGYGRLRAEFHIDRGRCGVGLCHARIMGEGISEETRGGVRVIGRRDALGKGNASSRR